LHPAFDALPVDLRDDALAQVAARQEFLDMQSSASLRGGPPPDWHVTAPAPADDLLGWYQGAGETYGVDWELLAAINLVETAMGRIQSDSMAGAQGPMQFIPETWARWGNGDVHDPYHAIYGAARYLASSGAAAGRVTRFLAEGGAFVLPAPCRCGERQVAGGSDEFGQVTEPADPVARRFTWATKSSGLSGRGTWSPPTEPSVNARVNIGLSYAPPATASRGQAAATSLGLVMAVFTGRKSTQRSVTQMMPVRSMAAAADPAGSFVAPSACLE